MDDLDTRVFKDNERRARFWEEFSQLVERYPEISDGLDDVLSGDMDERGILYDPDSPKFVQGTVIIMSIRNVDHWESMFVIEPPEQSHYMTYGLIASAADMQ
jgi:hypothetical protein